MTALFAHDGPLTTAAVYALRFGDDRSRREVRGLIDGTLDGDQEAEAWEHLGSLARRLDVLSSAVHSLPA